MVAGKTEIPGLSMRASWRRTSEGGFTKSTTTMEMQRGPIWKETSFAWLALALTTQTGWQRNPHIVCRRTQTSVVALGSKSSLLLLAGQSKRIGTHRARLVPMASKKTHTRLRYQLTWRGAARLQVESSSPKFASGQKCPSSGRTKTVLVLAK